MCVCICVLVKDIHNKARIVSLWSNALSFSRVLICMCVHSPSQSRRHHWPQQKTWLTWLTVTVGLSLHLLTPSLSEYIKVGCTATFRVMLIICINPLLACRKYLTFPWVEFDLNLLLYFIDVNYKPAMELFTFIDCKSILNRLLSEDKSCTVNYSFSFVTGFIIVAVSLQMGTELCPLFQSKSVAFCYFLFVFYDLLKFSIAKHRDWSYSNKWK